MEAGEDAVEIRRIRLAGKTPTVVETIYLPARLVPSIESAGWATEDLYELLDQRFGLRVSAADETVRATSIEPDDAAVLQVEPGTPGFLLERRAVAGGTVVELRRAVMRGDKCALTVSTTGDRVVD
jgi:GntR family transcriptional regulator